jgi:ankyrin repeat protein
MHIAATANASTLVQALLEMGEGYDTINHIGWDFLFFAASAGSADVLKTVFTMVENEKFYTKDNNKRNMYHLAAINNHFGIITTLFSLELKNYNDKDKFGKTPLHYAAMLGYSVISEFLSRIIETEEKDVLGMTPLHYAARGGFTEVLSILLNTGKFDINAKDNKGKSVIYTACEGGSIQTVQILVSKGADVNICPDDGTSLATVAVIKENIPLLKYLANIQDYDITTPDEKEWTPVHYASQLGNIEMLDLFYEKQPDSIFKANNKGRSPLSIAAVWGRLVSLSFFSRISETDFSIPDNEGNTPLHLSIINGNDEFSKALLKKTDADVNAQNNDGETPLMLAVRSWSTSVIAELVETGLCDLNLVDKNKRTALMFSTIEGQTNVVQYLINQPNIDCKLTDSNGWGPQHYAATLRTCDITKILVDSGKFNFNYITLKGKLPIDLAKERESDENIQYLNNTFQYDQPKRRNPKRPTKSLIGFIRTTPRHHTPTIIKIKSEVNEEEDTKKPSSSSSDSDYNYSEEESHDDDFLENEKKAGSNDSEEEEDI